jgi:hypothetical protein
MPTNDSSILEENFNEPVKESTCDLSKVPKLLPFLSGISLNGAVLSYIYEF